MSSEPPAELCAKMSASTLCYWAGAIAPRKGRNMSDNNTDRQHIEEQMRELLLDMMCGLRCYCCETVREFCVLKNRGQRPSPGNRFAYYEEDHDDLRGKIDRLVVRGWVVPVASNAEPIYRMTDEFAEHLLDGWPDRRWPDWWLALDWN